MSNLEELQKLIAIMKKNNLTKLKAGEFEIEMGSKSKRVRAPNKKASTQNMLPEAQERMPTEEEFALYSTDSYDVIKEQNDHEKKTN